MARDQVGTASASSDIGRMALLWCSGLGLRITILAVPPVIQMIRAEFRLSATEIGLLSGIPPAMFALNALGGSWLVAKLGVLRALVGGLLLVAAGSALRGASSDFTLLFLTTVAMSAGVAIMQPTLPVAVRQWVPARIGLGTAIYSNGLLVGELLPVWLASSIVLPLVGGSWRGALALWSIPVAITAALIAAFGPRTPAAQAARLGPAQLWLPDWRSRIVWRVGATLGGVSSMYFSTNAFLPGFLASRGRSDLIGPALTALNLGQIPASLLLLAGAGMLQRRAWPFYGAAAIALVALAGLVTFVGDATVVFAFLSGFADASGMILSLTLPPLLCRTEDLVPTSAGVFSVGYGSSVLVALLCGAMWDVSGHAELAFAPLFACAAVMLVSARDLRGRGELR